MQNLKKRRQQVKKLMGYALKGFYAFENDDVEAFIDKLEIKFKGRRNRHSLITQAILGHSKLFPIVSDVATAMWG